MKILWTHNWKPPIYPPLITNTLNILRELNVTIDLEYLGNLKSPQNIYLKKEHLKKISKNYDLVHSQYGSMCSYITASIDKIPKILSLHGSDLNITNQILTYDFFHSRLARFLTTNSLKRYNKVILVSKRMELDIKTNFPKTETKVMPYPIDLEKFKIRDKLDSRKKIKVKSNGHRVLFNIANINETVKRLSLAKDAIEIAKKTIPDISLHIINDINYDDVPLHVSSGDLTLLTSENEGWPNSIKESLACNIPFVSTDVSDLREISDIENICKVCSSNASEIAQNIIEVIQNKNIYYLRKYAEKMDIKVFGNKLKNLYKDTIDQYSQF